jgi:hypothetical protein
MTKEAPTETSAESNESIEYGKNVLVSIDLIRHPEKDPATGKLTKEGKERFLEQLNEDFKGTEDYDTIKFYVSPLPRGQEAKESITPFLDAENLQTTIRNKKELVGRFMEVGPTFKAEMTAILEQADSMTAAEIEKMRERDKSIAAYEPASKDFETKSNEILIREFFDKNLPGAGFTGREHAEVVGNLVDHFADMATHFKSGSRVKLVLVGHSGVIEYLTKKVYLDNHPEVKPGDVGVNTLGGLVDFSHGPEITIQSDSSGEQHIKFKFKDLDLDYKPQKTQ